MRFFFLIPYSEPSSFRASVIIFELSLIIEFRFFNKVWYRSILVNYIAKLVFHFIPTLHIPDLEHYFVSV